MKEPKEFAPVLRYLVQQQGMYVHPSRSYFSAGQTVWADPTLYYDNLRDAKRFADSVGGEVIKLRVSARRERIKHKVTPAKDP